MMLAHGNRFRRRRNVAHPPPRIIPRKRKHRLHFRIQREILRHGQVNRAPRSIQVKSPLLGPPQRRRNPMIIPQEKIRRVYQRVVLVSYLLLRLHLESPQRRLRKRIVHRAPFVGVVAHRAILQVFLNKQHLRPAPLKPYDACCPQLPAVQPNVIRPHARRKPALVKELAPPLVDLQPQLPLLRIPIKIEVPRKLLRPRRLLRNRSRLPSLSSAPSPKRRRQRHRRQQNAKPMLRHVHPSKPAEWFYNRITTMANAYPQQAARTFILFQPSELAGRFLLPEACRLKFRLCYTGTSR